VPLSGSIEERFRGRVEALPAGTRRLLLLVAAEPTGQHRGGGQVLHPPGPGKLVHVGGDAAEDRPHPGQIDGHHGPAGPAGSRAQVDRWRVAVSVQVREPVRALPHEYVRSKFTRR